MRGGRTLLAKTLKGSKDKKVIEHRLQDCPVYGAFAHMAIDDIHARIDKAISEGYLSYEYDGRLPLLVYTHTGWEIERETYAEELFQKLRATAEDSETAFDVATLRGRNRVMIDRLLNILETRADERFVPVLHRWQVVEHQKLRQRISDVIHAITTRTASRDRVRTT